MSNKQVQLDISALNLQDVSNLQIGIVKSAYNDEVTDKLETGAKEILIQAGLREDQMTSLIVPGAFELPLGVKSLLSNHKLDAVLALGCVIKGETKHDVYISQATANAIMQLNLISNKPIMFGVLTTNDELQALERAGGKFGNKGSEVAYGALMMLSNMDSKKDKSKIGFGNA